MSYIDIKYLRLISGKLRNFKQKNHNLFNFSCPFCGDSHKNSRKARGYVYFSKGTYFYKCHNCNINTHLSGLIELVDPGSYKEYTLEVYLERKERETPIKIPDKILSDPSSSINFKNIINCKDLPAFHPVIKYLRERMMPKSQYPHLYYTDNFKALINEFYPTFDGTITDDARLILPFTNEAGEVVALSGRSLEKKPFLRYSTVRKFEDAPMAFGINRINPSRVVKIVEGPLDSLFITNAVASGNANLLHVLRNTKIKDPIFIFDNEPRNVEIVKEMEKVIKEGHKIVIWPDEVVGRGKDINLMILSGFTSMDLERIIAGNTFKNLGANLEFNRWKKV